MCSAVRPVSPYTDADRPVSPPFHIGQAFSRYDMLRRRTESHPGLPELFGRAGQTSTGESAAEFAYLAS